MKKDKKYANTISLTVSKGTQSVTYQEVLSWISSKEPYRTFKLRVSIKSDFYHSQNHARVDVWSDEALAWNHVHSIHPGAMFTPEGLMYNAKGESPTHFQDDRQELLGVATAILGGVS